MVRRRLLLSSTIAVVLCGCAGGSGSSAAFTPATRPAPRPHPNTLRLLQLNVREGATNGRATAVAALIKDLQPDVATLDEVAYRSIFDHIASVTGMYGYWARANDVFSVGILSRVPLHDCTPYRQKPIQHAAYSCRVRLGDQSWRIFGAHLACCRDGAERQRAQEAAILTTEMNRDRSLPVVLAGDLNSHAPGDPDQMPAMLVVPELIGAGFVDSFRELHPVAQDPGLTITAPPYGNWEARIDYVFHSKLARATSARVISSVRGHRWPSDHAALLVTLAPNLRRAHPASSR